MSSDASAKPKDAGPRQACEVCRERKVRCDRADPKCGRCVRLRLPCCYDDIPRRRLRQDLPRQLQELQERLARAESRLDTGATSVLVKSGTGGMEAHLDAPFRPTAPPAPTELIQGPVVDGLNTGNNVFSALGTGATEWVARDFDSHLMDLNQFADTPATWLGDWSSLIDMAPESMPGLEYMLPAKNALSPAAIDSVEDSELATLHDSYFAIVHATMPFLREDRFRHEIGEHPEHLPAKCLSYAVALMGSALSPAHRHLGPACYKLARHNIELCEQGDDEDLGSINLFQSLILIVRYEILSPRLTKAWMTLGRAVRLCKMMSLHCLDGDEDTRYGGLRVPPLPPRDEADLEERRRSFWTLYIFEVYVRTRTGVPGELGEAQTFEVNLPCHGSLVSDFTRIPMPRLRDADVLDPAVHAGLSSYAACVLMVDIAMRCFNHDGGDKPSDQKKGFWDGHYTLIKEIEQRTAMLQPHMNPHSVRTDPVAFSLQMNLCASEILFHEAAIEEATRKQLPRGLVTESESRSTAMAFKIVGAVRLNWPAPQSGRDIFTIQATFIAWPMVMAMKSLARELEKMTPGSPSSRPAAHSLRLLVTALDHVEEAGGYWHLESAVTMSFLLEWEGQLDPDSVVL